MALSQAEADQLLTMSKLFVDQDPLEFSQSESMNYNRELRSADRRERFFLTIERGMRNRLRLKYQTRARSVIVLARLELNGPRHKNPPNAPYKPGEWLSGTHLHVYREGFEARIAYELADAPGWASDISTDAVVMLENFFRFCGVTQWPNIQTAI
jgi:hypothetical protein